MECGYQCIFAQAVGTDSPVEIPSDLPPAVSVIRRPNRGYDFGSWASALALFPEVATRSHVLMVNDSMIGPFGALSPVIDDFESTYADYWGALGSQLFFPHNQSFFLGFRGGMLAQPVLRRWWQRVEHLDDKWEIISQYELGLGRLLHAEAYSRASFLHARQFSIIPENPMIGHWRDVVRAGFPFIKREIVTNETLHQADQVAEFLRDLDGSQPQDWL